MFGLFSETEWYEEISEMDISRDRTTMRAVSTQTFPLVRMNVLLGESWGSWIPLPVGIEVLGGNTEFAHHSAGYLATRFKRGTFSLSPGKEYVPVLHARRTKLSPIPSRHPVGLKVHHHVDDIRTQLDEPPLYLFRDVMAFPDG